MKFKTINHKNDVNETTIWVPDSYDGKMEKLLNKLDIPYYYFNPAQRLDKQEIYSRIKMDELDSTLGFRQVEVDVEKLDNLLKLGKNYVAYKGIGGSMEKYANFKEFLHTKNTIEPPKVSLTRDEFGDVITKIEDGRHRFAVLRDMGLKKIPVRMTEDSENLAKEIELI
ncbi:hypothetical protein IKQ26_01805 [bacterium]|nr:hypothetical protein [bacterium]